MEIRLLIQFLFVWLCGWLWYYKKDHNIKYLDEKPEPAPLLFWVIMWLLFPIAFMWWEFMDKLEDICKKLK